MPMGSQLPVRLDEETSLRLDRIASESGTTKSSLIRLLAKSFTDHCLKEGRVVLPMNWKELLKAPDGRTLKLAEPTDLATHAPARKKQPQPVRYNKAGKLRKKKSPPPKEES